MRAPAGCSTLSAQWPVHLANLFFGQNVYQKTVGRSNKCRRSKLEVRSKLNLDEPQSTARKLWLTAYTLFFGIVITLLFLLIYHTVRWQPFWLSAARVLAEAFWVFLILVSVFIWYRPAWLRPLYLAAESKVVFVAYLFAYAIVFMFFSAVLFVLVSWLFEL